MDPQEEIILRGKVGVALMDFYINFLHAEGCASMEAAIKEATEKIINIVRNSPKPVHPYKNNDDLRQLLGMKDW